MGGGGVHAETGGGIEHQGQDQLGGGGGHQGAGHVGEGLERHVSGVGDNLEFRDGAVELSVAEQVRLAAEKIRANEDS